MINVVVIIRITDPEPDLTILAASISRQSHDRMSICLVCASNSLSFADPLLEQMGKLTDRAISVSVITSQDVWDRIPRDSYVIFPDTNSLLEPEFVSCLAEYLDRHNEACAVRCNGSLVDERDLDFLIAPIIDRHKPHEGALVEPLVARETSLHLAAWMLRSSCLTEAAVTMKEGNFASMDWHIALTVAHAGSVGYLPANLFRQVRRVDGTMRDLLTHYHSRVKLQETIHRSCIEAIEKLPAPETHKCRWRNCATIAAIIAIVETDRTFRQWSRFSSYREELSRVVADLGGDPRSLYAGAGLADMIAPLRVEDATGILTRLLGQLLLQVLMNRLSTGTARWILETGFGIFPAAAKQRRVIFYGAGGAAAGVLPVFLATGFRPEYIWDRAASTGQTLSGVPVVPPDFATFNEPSRSTYEIIVTLGHKRVAEEVRQLLVNNGFSSVAHVPDSEAAGQYLLQCVCAGCS